ncbi:uncharacterized protein LOC143892989 [Tasmannia lanceolata]|uniref:uncharacterized protein LOC143892989 n=1 Tax=Tasmannia lanceolata TaxID=3420 RepID=UPI00406429C6
MNILEPVLPATMLQQIDLQSNVLGYRCSSKFSTVGDLSRSKVFGQSRNKASADIKSNGSLGYDRSHQQAYVGPNEFSPSPGFVDSGANSSAGLVTDSTVVDKLEKHIAKKKYKKKKGKSKKKCLDVVSDEYAKAIVTTSHQSFKDDMEDGDDYKVTLICNGGCSLTACSSHLYSSVSDTQCSSGNGVSCKSVAERGVSSSQDSVSEDLKVGDSSEIIRKAEQSNSSIGKEIMSDCKNSSNEDLFETGYLRNLSQDKSCGTDGVNNCSSNLVKAMCPKESGSFGSGNGGGQCSDVTDVQAVAPNKRVEHDRQLSRNSRHSPNHENNHNQIGKENTQSIWQKTRKNTRDVRSNGVKRSTHIHVQIDVGTKETNLLLNHNLFSGDRLLPSPTLPSAEQSSFTQKVKEVMKMNNEQQNFGTYGPVLVESRKWVGQQQDESQGNMTLGKSKEKLNLSFKHENINHGKRGFWANKANFYRLKNKTNLSQKEVLEVSTKAHLCKSSTAEQTCTLNGHYCKSDLSETDEFGYLPSEHLLVGSLHASLDNEEKTSVPLEIELSCEQNIRQEFPSRVTIQKWIPIGREHPWILKRNGVVGACNDEPILHFGKADSHQEEYDISISGVVPSLDHGITCFSSNQGSMDSSSIEIKSEMRQCDKLSNGEENYEQESRKESVASDIKTKDISSSSIEIKSEMRQCDKLSNGEENYKQESRKESVASDIKAKDVSFLYIGSQVAIQALNEAYRLQIASERVQLATGSPLAEFERLLHSASPVIIPSSVQKHCQECLGSQLILNPLCKHQIPNIPLSEVWHWYEKPGSYGLEVKAEDSQNLKGMDTDVVSFHAHFVPFLSAVQLFGQSHHSKCSGTGNLRPEVPDKLEPTNFPSPPKDFTSVSYPETIEPHPSEGVKICLSELFNSVENSLSSLKISANDGSFDLTSALSSADDIELIFEYFEYEQPQQRKPLYDKIMDLIKVGASNHRVFGDPSKLGCMNMHDLHPASWYSVAWYPIYRIPEGNFRASFLTYHSLGHLVQRCVATDSLDENAFCIVSPVLGLQSYNAQGECWFSPKMPAGCSSNGFMSFCNSEILKERLRSLEETALLLARGFVFKDHVKVANRQPDYEFFLSRKH